MVSTSVLYTLRDCSNQSGATVVKGGIVLTVSVGDVWYNTATGKAVTTVQVTEHVVSLQTQSGFTYDYDYGQFLNEYTREPIHAKG